MRNVLKRSSFQWENNFVEIHIRMDAAFPYDRGQVLLMFWRKYFWKINVK